MAACSTMLRYFSTFYQINQSSRFKVLSVSNQLKVMPHSPSSVYLLCNPAAENEAGVSDADYDVSDAGVNHSEVSDAEGPSQNMSRPFEGDENSSGVAVKWTVFVLTVIICSGLTGDHLFSALNYT